MSSDSQVSGLCASGCNHWAFPAPCGAVCPHRSTNCALVQCLLIRGTHNFAHPIAIADCIWRIAKISLFSKTDRCFSAIESLHTSSLFSLALASTADYGGAASLVCGGEQAHFRALSTAVAPARRRREMEQIMKNPRPSGWALVIAAALGGA